MSDSTDSSDSSEVAEEKPVESPKLEFTEPKDGGTAAWLTAAAAFLLFVITWVSEQFWQSPGRHLRII